ncbi:MAG: sodium-translocating pyrophosphatase [Saccharofermentanales bacterium]|jgi:K(+)-stimulated pyrophosphate-energized sodium pump
MVIALVLLLFAAVLGLAYSMFNFYYVKRFDEGTERMQRIAAAVRLGTNTFIVYEYKIVAKIALALAVLLGVAISWQMALSFLIGAIMSGSAGWVGMKIATYANVRVTNRARETNSLGETLKLAYRGGSVMGLCVGGFALLGIFIVYLVFGVLLGQYKDLVDAVATTNWWGLPISFTLTLSGYALGCSVIAMFNRVGGGIYTKAADMGADLVGKTEVNIPEDDPRNPATIADNVGDNVGDVAGLGADLLESYVGAIMSAIILASELFRSHHTVFSSSMLENMMFYPFMLAAGGMISCVIGTFVMLARKKLSDFPHKELNRSTYISASLTMIVGFFITLLQFSNMSDDLSGAGFSLGFLSPWVASCLGVLSGIVIGYLAEYYTSYDYNPTRNIAESSKEGPALTVTEGMSVGFKSTMAPVVVIGVAILISYTACGMYGVAMAATGMLAFVTATVSVDTYGPISDNAGGIAEMSGLDHSVRDITDTLDAVGNTTAAIGKGFAIGSAALAALSMMVSYLFSFTPADQPLSLNLVEPMTLAGGLVGAALPFLFSGILINAVTRTAREMVVEVRRQFAEIKGLLDGTADPDYKTCIEISSRGALNEMKIPALMSVGVPVICGFLFGVEFVGGLLIGSTLSAVMMALAAGNMGGAWDNAKKYIEAGMLEGFGRGSDAHDAAVIGDTIGDPLKDTVGPSLNILIKIMSVVSLVMVTLFSRYNLVGWISGLF